MRALSVGQRGVGLRREWCTALECRTKSLAVAAQAARHEAVERAYLRILGRFRGAVMIFLYIFCTF
jgi:hypothetical protein